MEPKTLQNQVSLIQQEKKPFEPHQVNRARQVPQAQRTMSAQSLDADQLPLPRKEAIASQGFP